MWMLVMFDLPVMESEERKEATGFRNFLLDQGFEMAQFSVYLRYCTGPEQVEALTQRIQKALPVGGKIDILCFTDRQYERIVSYSGRKRGPQKKNPDQYVLF